VGEVFGPPKNIVRYYGGKDGDGLHLAFNFPFVRIWDDRWNAAHVRERVDAFEAALEPGLWPNHVFGNHDVDRLISRVNRDGHGHERARVAALLLLTLRGTPFVYYGEELGMENVDVPEEMLQDPARTYGRGRDPERTPMQWTRTGGFTQGKPWLPYGKLAYNVQDEGSAAASLLSLYRRLIWLRRGSDALRSGDYTPVDPVPVGIYAYVRSAGAERMLVVLNFTNDLIEFELSGGLRVAETLLGTHEEAAGSTTETKRRGGDRAGAAQQITLAGNEGRLLQLA
jgi:alpha-glucosidase